MKVVELREGMTMADLPRCSAQGHERGPLLPSELLFVALCVETSTCDPGSAQLIMLVR